MRDRKLWRWLWIDGKRINTRPYFMRARRWSCRRFGHWWKKPFYMNLRWCRMCWKAEFLSEVFDE